MTEQRWMSVEQGKVKNMGRTLNKVEYITAITKLLEKFSEK